MAKSKKLKPDEPQRGGISDEVPGSKEQVRRPRDKNTQWFKKQNKIPIRIDTYPLPQKPRTMRYQGTDAQVINYFDFEGLKPLAEKRIRARTVQNLKRNNSNAKLNQANWNDFAAQALASACEEALFDLNFLVAIGNQEAAATLGRLAREIVKNVIAISDSHTAALKGVAEHSINWPVLEGKKPALGDGGRFINTLNVGGKAPFSQELVSKTSGKYVKEMMNLAQKLLCRLDDWRTGREPFIKSVNSFPPPTKAEKGAVSLPEFSKDTWEEWAECAWNILLEENNVHPEQNEKLRRFGQYREKHTAVTSQLASGLLPSGKIPTTDETNIRDGIQKRLQDAVKRCTGIKPEQNLKTTAIK